MSFAEAAAFAGLVLNATSGSAAMAALVGAGEAALAGKVLIDVSNPLDFSRGMLPTLGPGEPRQPR
jgi:8-hydroxy-5-deazaflavin:NADPH oxidoreductase